MRFSKAQVFEKEPGVPEKGHLLGRIMELKEDSEGQVYVLQPYAMAGCEYGAPLQRPWCALGAYCQRRSLVLRVDLEHDRYLRDLSVEDPSSVI